MSVLERMDEGLKVLECLLPAYFKVEIIVIIMNIAIIVLIIVIVWNIINSFHRNTF